MSSEFIVTKPQPAPADTEILLVEDDDFEAKAVLRAFKKAGVSIKITRAEDGIEALAVLRSGKLGDTPASKLILLVDLNMPRMNGIELLQEIRKDPKLQMLICFVLTTSKAATDISEAYKLNVAGYIVKPQAGGDFGQLVQLLEDYRTTVRMPLAE